MAAKKVKVKYLTLSCGPERTIHPGETATISATDFAILKAAGSVVEIVEADEKPNTSASANTNNSGDAGAGDAGAGDAGAGDAGAGDAGAGDAGASGGIINTLKNAASNLISK